MCGITGWIDWQRDLTKEGEVLQRMTKALTARGPDAEGYYESHHAALGHRRLIVLDPAGGEQPMTRYQGERAYTIIYNGEIYNMGELRVELESRGHRFKSRNSDTETLLLSFLEWGEGCLDYLNGIFAFAIWDEQEQRLFMARDRLGVKPLFYTEIKGGVLLASELKALLAHPQVEPVLGAEGLAEVFALGPARSPGHGVYKGVHEVKPGHFLRYDRQGLQVRRYWSLKSQEHPHDLQETAMRVKELLQEAVKRQLISDMPVCTLLSGGLDSSALSAFAAAALEKEGRGPLHTYSVDYVENARFFTPSSFQPDADAPWVEVVSKHLGSQHKNVVVDIGELIEALHAATMARDLPGMADVDSSLYLFCREIKKGATVALSGEAADEIFGGYPWYHKEEALCSGGFPWVRSLTERLSLLTPEVRNSIRGAEYIEARYWQTVEDVPKLPGESFLDEKRRELFYLNITWFMTTLLDRKDRMSMASGLEVRVPYCDHQLVEYVWNIPWDMKTAGRMGKGILRRALEGVLPKEVLMRKKSPYPKTHHPVYLEGVRKELLQRLSKPNSPLFSLVDGEKIRTQLSNRKNLFTEPWFGQLMTEPQYYAYLIQVDTWLREYGVRIKL